MPGAIVTGAASGIGAATCKALLAARWSVFGVDIQEAPQDVSFRYLKINITESGAADTIVQKAKEAFGGRVDALVNVAGIMDLLQSVDTLDEKLWDRVMAVNLTAPVRLMGAVVRAFREQGEGGAIANVGSYAGISGAAAGVAYTASKHGLVGATKNTAFRFKGEGIRCNIVLPGGVQTEIMKDIDMTKFDPESAAVLGGVRNAAHPNEMILKPEAIASMLVHLVSDNSKGVNGAVIPIDNGWSTI